MHPGRRFGGAPEALSETEFKTESKPLKRLGASSVSSKPWKLFPMKKTAEPLSKNPVKTGFYYQALKLTQLAR